MKRADFTYFLLNIEDVTGEIALFSESESRHMVRVCRLKEGDSVVATDGAGSVFDIQIAATAGGRVEGIILDMHTVSRREQRCSLAVPLSTIQKSDWVVEKCTEIGVDGFLIFPCGKGTIINASDSRRRRLERVAISAMKQSMRAYSPTIQYFESFDEFLMTLFQYDIALLGHLDQDSATISELVYSLAVTNVLTIIGPESGFMGNEVVSLREAGARTVRFGDGRLRMETAAVVLPAVVLESFEKTPGV
jgi:16S rRNA (uracil1498-N3)-methyltransferase